MSALPARCLAANSFSWRRCLCAGVVALALASPGPAYCYTLEELLGLTLERLLQLEISPPPKPQAWSSNVLTVMLQRSHHAA